MKSNFKWILVFSLLLTLFGCFSNNAEEKIIKDSLKGINNTENLEIKATNNISGIEVQMNKKILSEEIVFGKDILGMVSTEGDTTIISLTSKSEILNGDTVITILNSPENLDFKVLDVVKKEDIEQNLKLKKGLNDVLLGDFDTNGIVDLLDFKEFRDNYGDLNGYNAKYDIAPAQKGIGDWDNIYSLCTPDGEIKLLDFVIFARNYNEENPDKPEGITIYVEQGYGDGLYAWDDGETTKPLGTWPGGTFTETINKEGHIFGMYTFEIDPVNYLIMKNDKKVTATNQVTTSDVWWDINGNKSAQCPYEEAGAIKPSVDISALNATLKGIATFTISINDNGYSITNKTAEFNGQTVTLGSNTVSLLISDYLSDGETGNIKVTATNEAGITEVEGTITRNDAQAIDKFDWDNATVYFVLTDRFNNGDTSNDESYGRKKDYGSTELNTGTFHGGDIKGLTDKLNYLDDLGVNAIWLTAPYEQVHGWAGGGSSTKGNGKTFPHYAYHGYYPGDFTGIDKNMGTVEEFRTFVDTAHAKGIRVILDIVMNHTGYNTLLDMEQYNFGGFKNGASSTWEPSDGKWDTVWKAVDWDTNNWAQWWGNDWIAAGLPTYEDRTQTVDENPIQSSLNGLPDVRTETTTGVGVPPYLQTKWGKETTGYDNWIIPAAKKLRKNLNIAPAEYITQWLAAWVEEFGIDGFRVDTAKHVEMYRWKNLKAACTIALETWRSNHSTDAAANWNEPFWMTGEAWNHGANKSNYHTEGNFDSIINFQFPKDGNIASIGGIWAGLASSINSDSSWNVLHYLNSHDHKEFAGWNQTTKDHGTTLLLAPGGVQIYYGDEYSRQLGPEVSDPNQCTRSDFDWSNYNNEQLAHWQKLGQFRRNHPSVGAGQQVDLGNNSYGRTYSKNGLNDKVVIAVSGSGTSSINVSGIFADGTKVRNAYNGNIATVSSGAVNFTFENGVILIEEVK